MTNSPPDRAPDRHPVHRLLDRHRYLERQPMPALVKYQAQRLEEIVRHARSHVPFYADHFAAAFNTGDCLDLSRWQDLPILDSAMARNNAEALKAAETPAAAGGAIDDQTTGSGGSPFRFIRSLSAYTADSANSMRVHADHEFDFDARFADIRFDRSGFAAYPDGAMRRSWTYGAGNGDYALLDINTPLEDMIEWLLRRQPGILFTWASNARRIALELERTGKSLPLTAIATSADQCTAGVLADCHRVFGIRPVNIMGAREVGVMAFACNEEPTYHLAAESAFFEVVDDDGKPVGPGRTGQLVVTPFFNFHQPLIRYATGDYVTLASGQCACGRSLPAIAALRGRARNRYRRMDGEKLFPELPESELDRLAGPLQWQIVQTGPGRLELRCDPEAFDKIGNSMSQLHALLAASMGENVTLELKARDSNDGPRRRKHELFRDDSL